MFVREFVRRDDLRLEITLTVPIRAAGMRKQGFRERSGGSSPWLIDNQYAAASKVCFVHGYRLAVSP